MLRYRKGVAPAALTALQAAPGKTYGHLRDEDRIPLREALVQDQGWLCAYCQRRIKPGREMKIEHWAPQSLYPERSLQWSNLLGVCHGGAPNAPGPSDDTTDQHCDTSRGNTPLFLHPVEGAGGGDPGQHLRYSAAGEVRSDDQRAAQDIRTLNLNLLKLKNARAHVYDELMRDLKRRFTLGELHRLRARHQIERGVPAPPHAAFLLYHLEKKIKANSHR